MRDLTLDLGHGDPRVPPDVKIFIGPTGPKMMELTGEIADGALINGILPPTYTRRSLERMAAGAARAGRTLDDVEKLQLVNISMNADPANALYDAIGVRIYKLPLTPDVVLAAIERKAREDRKAARSDRTA